MLKESKAWLVEGCRTPIGSFKKTLKRVQADKLAAHTMSHVLAKADTYPEQLDGVILGHGYQSSYTPNTARCAALAAGIPASIPAATVQRQCGSGMEAANTVMKDIFLGAGDLYLAAGVESMSTVPYMLPSDVRYKGPLSKYFPLGPRPVVVKVLDDGLSPNLWDPVTTFMTYTAQRLADTYQISREDADAYALRSHQLAVQAIKSGRFEQEIVPIDVRGKGPFALDEHPRANTTAERLASLRPASAFKGKGVRDITAGNSSGINDGACALLIASDKAVRHMHRKPLAELVDSCVVGVDPYQMGLGPVAAINKLMKRNGLTLADIDLFEINEAFAAQYLACEKLLGLDREKVNVNGGAIALGHPIGMSGARLLHTLALELKARGLKRGIASLCIGGGMGIATLLEVHK